MQNENIIFSLCACYFLRFASPIKTSFSMFRFFYLCMLNENIFFSLRVYTTFPIIHASWKDTFWFSSCISKTASFLSCCMLHFQSFKDNWNIVCCVYDFVNHAKWKHLLLFLSLCVYFIFCHHACVIKRPSSVYTICFVHACMIKTYSSLCAYATFFSFACTIKGSSFAPTIFCIMHA